MGMETKSFAGWAKEGDGQSFTVQQFCANTLWSDIFDLQTRVASMVAFVVQTADKPNLPLVVFGGSLKEPARARQDGVLNLPPPRENVTVTSASCWRFLCVQRGISLLSRNANNSNTTASLTPLNMLVWYNNTLAFFTLCTLLLKSLEKRDMTEWTFDLLPPRS